jgi:TldD protein
MHCAARIEYVILDFHIAVLITEKESMSLQETGALAQFGLSEAEVARALGRVKVRDVDYADLYFEYCQTDSVSMEEGRVKRATKNAWGFAPSPVKRQDSPTRMN